MAPISTNDPRLDYAPSPEGQTDIKPISQEPKLRWKDNNDDETLEQVLRVWQYSISHDAHTVQEIGAAESLLLNPKTPKRSPSNKVKTPSNEFRAEIIHNALEKALERYLRKCGYLVGYGSKRLCACWFHELTIRPLPSWMPINKIEFEEAVRQEFYGPDIGYYDEKSRILGNLLHGANQPPITRSPSQGIR